MKIAIYSLTFNRLQFTIPCFNSLWKQSYPYDHYVLDNGSTDGTLDWLTKNKDKFKEIISLPFNKGISKGSNTLLDVICKKDYSLIIKMDNDCEIISLDILENIVNIYKTIATRTQNIEIRFTDGVTINRKKEFSKNYILSPTIIGVTSPLSYIHETINNYKLNLTTIVGGVFQVVPMNIYKSYRYPEKLPLSSGQDTHFCNWARDKNFKLGYIEDLKVNHYGQN
jgi:glycosyltransferase involved in cell wall biosynthesis